MKNEMGAQELGNLIGITASRTRELTRQGVLVRDGSDGKTYNVARNVKAAFAHLRAGAAGRSGAAAAGVAKARQRVLQLQGDKLADERARELGKLVETEVVREGLECICRALQSLMMAVPTRLAGRSPLSREDIELVRDEIREALTEAASMSLPQLREIAMAAKELAP
jgi:phage terminase Nu1 subunit (DNA packaging protein)